MTGGEALAAVPARHPLDVPRPGLPLRMPSADPRPASSKAPMTTTEFAEAVIEAGRSLYTAAGVSVDAMRAAQNDLYRLALIVMARTTDTLDAELGWLIESIWVDHCLDKPAAVA